MNEYLKNPSAWVPPQVPEEIPHGDMPGDRICIGAEHVKKAEALFPALLPLLREAVTVNPGGRAVISVCGGSGVGKSEIASVLGFYLRSVGIGTYILSGDNYPRRIPRDNDLERLRVFRVGGLRGLLDSGLYQDAQTQTLHALWAEEKDADPGEAKDRPWLQVYQQAGRLRLAEYLGTPNETDFAEVDQIMKAFKDGADKLWLKRMGRDEASLWYDEIDMSDKQVLIVEWTHGNSDYMSQVDIPVLLNSTPAETLEHRRSRNRDGKLDSPFTMLVLELEQAKLVKQAHKAKIIISKAGDIISFDQFQELMK